MYLTLRNIGVSLLLNYFPSNRNYKVARFALTAQHPVDRDPQEAAPWVAEEEEVRRLINVN